MNRAEKLEKCIYDLVFAYVNKDDELPHSFEVDALKAAHELLPEDKLIQKVYEDTYEKTHH